MTLPLALLAGYCALLAAAALQDFRSLRISNAISVALLLVSLGHAASSSAAPFWEHLAAFAIALGGGILLFSRGWLGGGDAKLFAAAAAWFGLAQFVWFLSAAMIAGALVTLILLAVRGLLPKGQSAPGGWLGLRRGRSIPYGVAIAIGGILIASLIQSQARSSGTGFDPLRPTYPGATTPRVPAR